MMVQKGDQVTKSIIMPCKVYHFNYFLGGDVHAWGNDIGLRMFMTTYTLHYTVVYFSYV